MSTRSALKAVAVRPGRDAPEFVIAELTPSQVLEAYRMAGQGGTVAQARLRMLQQSIREVDGQKVSYVDVLTRFNVLLPRTRWVTVLSMQLQRLMSPSEEQLIEVLGSVRSEVGPEGFVQFVCLPDGREVELAEISFETVGAAMEQARLGARQNDDAELRAAIEGCQRSIRCIAGTPVTPESWGSTYATWDKHFSVADTLLLGRVYAEMHGEDEGVEVGETKPLGGTP